MLILSTTQSNKVVVTLREKSTLITPYYTWQIVNQNSFDTTIFSPENFTTSPYYDAFTISIGTPSSLTSSVTLDLVPGEYHYKVYEMNTQYDLNIQNAVDYVEIGLFIVDGTFSISDIIAFTQSNDDTIRVFNSL
jgi:hypothetical protein